MYRVFDFELLQIGEYKQAARNFYTGNFIFCLFCQFCRFDRVRVIIE